MNEHRTGLVTGTTGYVGAQVARQLLDDGWTVRALVRDAEGLEPDLCERMEVIEGDASYPEDVARAMVGAEVAWFLTHAMGGEGDFVEQERRIAEVFAEQARRAGLTRIVYLGGLHPDGQELSPHLASRVEVGEILMGSGVPTAAIQAGVVLGDGSASFEMLRTLAERLPGSVGPQWLRNRIQPIHVDDVVHFLVRAADLPASENRTFDVGGPDVLSYAEMMARYAKVKRLGPRPALATPVMSPALASRWIGLVSSIPSALARPLVESLQHDNVAHEDDLAGIVGLPERGMTGFDDAVRRETRDHDDLRWLKVLAATSAAVTACAVVGIAATIPVTDSRWFRQLQKPSWQPPNALFGPVWTLLYADIAVVAALHLADCLDAGETDEARRDAVALGVNLLLNAGWSVVFWRGRSLPAATAVAAALAASSTDLVRRVGRRPERGAVLAPYAAWSTFATFLTGALWRRNPS